MFVILVYDVKSSHDAKVMRRIKKFLVPVQESVFEGHITEKMLFKLKQSLIKIIDPECDYIKIYCFNSISFARQEELGCARYINSNII